MTNQKRGLPAKTTRHLGNMVACPECGHGLGQVIDSRLSPDGRWRRRRVCARCDARFLTYETVARSADLAHSDLKFLVNQVDGASERLDAVREILTNILTTDR